MLKGANAHVNTPVIGYMNLLLALLATIFTEGCVPLHCCAIPGLNTYLVMPVWDMRLARDTALFDWLTIFPAQGITQEGDWWTDIEYNHQGLCQG